MAMILGTPLFSCRSPSAESTAYEMGALDTVVLAGTWHRRVFSPSRANRSDGGFDCDRQAVGHWVALGSHTASRNRRSARVSTRHRNRRDRNELHERTRLGNHGRHFLAAARPDYMRVWYGQSAAGCVRDPHSS